MIMKIWTTSPPGLLGDLGWLWPIEVEYMEIFMISRNQPTWPNGSRGKLDDIFYNSVASKIFPQGFVRFGRVKYFVNLRPIIKIFYWKILEIWKEIVSFSCGIVWDPLCTGKKKCSEEATYIKTLQLPIPSKILPNTRKGNFKCLLGSLENIPWKLIEILKPKFRLDIIIIKSSILCRIGPKIILSNSSQISQ